MKGKKEKRRTSEWKKIRTRMLRILFVAWMMIATKERVQWSGCIKEKGGRMSRTKVFFLVVVALLFFFLEIRPNDER